MKLSMATGRRLQALRRGTFLQRGSYLLEALIAILIFSFGILGLVGLLSVSVRATNDARSRSEAANLANAMVGEMWSMTSAQMTTDFGSGGARLAAYKTKVATLLPNSTTTVVLAQGLSSQSRDVVVTITWQMPGSTETHQYVTSAQIGKNG